MKIECYVKILKLQQRFDRLTFFIQISESNHCGKKADETGVILAEAERGSAGYPTRNLQISAPEH